MSFSLGAAIIGAGARILNLWQKLSRDWAVDTRNWNDIT